jgi:hypothetical protein
MRPVAFVTALQNAGAMLFALCTLLLATGRTLAVETGRVLSFETGGPSGSSGLALHGKGAHQQVLVTAKFPSGPVRDWTREVKFEVSPPNVVAVDPRGQVSALGDGRATITAVGLDGAKASLDVSVTDCETLAPINFPNQIVPIFTKAGCNAGGCHGKASGQNGFRLSLLGFEPKEDYEHLVKESRGRRLSPAAPERSLLLLKATATLPHGGGKRLEIDSADYALLVRWISEGLPYGKPTDPTVASISVAPSERTLTFGGQQQLIVTAHYTDGSNEDVTQSALFEANEKEMGAADASGMVDVFQQPGDFAVMVRYQARVGVFRATVPLGHELPPLPQPRNFVDELVFRKWKALGLPPSDRCDDATFVRRAALDIAGRLPTPEETKRFLDDPDAGKRDRWIDQLLESTGYADYFGNKWSALLRNRRSNPNQTRSTYAFYDWVRDSLMENKPYDQFVRELVTAAGDIDHDPAVAWFRQVRDPQTEMEDTAQLFLGMRLQCAQCHHHPFEKWSQQDYYGLTAFFSNVSRKQGPNAGEDVVYAKRGVPSAVNKKTKQPVAPAGLGATPLELTPDDDPRQALADWLTSKENPFFARSLVNRYWKHFFGRGLVDPEDDMRETNPPSNPELLTALAKYFVYTRYDLKELVRTICRSETYQREALPNGFNQADRQNFSHFYPKRLTAEVLLDAVDQVTRSESAFEGLPPGTRAIALPDNSFNASSYFLTVFGRPESSSACECERSQDASLAQSLHLLNAKELQEKLSADTGRAALLAADHARSDRAKLTELYYWAYSRAPSQGELDKAEAYLQSHERAAEKKDPKAERQAFEDIIWALLNTKEFLFNH